MDRRLVITPKRPSLHEFVKSDTPGVCARCQLIKRNAVHVAPDDPRLVELEQAQQEHRRRIGDQP